MTLTQNNKAPTKEEPTVETQTSNDVSPNSQQVIHMTVNGSARIQQISSADEKKKLPNALGGGFSFGPLPNVADSCEPAVVGGEFNFGSPANNVNHNMLGGGFSFGSGIPHESGGFGGIKVVADSCEPAVAGGEFNFGSPANNVNHNMFGGGGFNGNNINNGGGMGGGMFGNNNGGGMFGNNNNNNMNEQCDRSDVHTHIPANNMFGRNHRGGRGAGRGGGRAGGITTPQFGCTTPHDAYNDKKWARFYERDPIRAATYGYTKAHYNAYLQKNFNNFDNKLKCRYGSHCKSGSRCKFTHDTDSLHRPSKVQGNKNRYASSYDKRNLAKRKLRSERLRSERKNKNKKKIFCSGATFIVGLLALLFLGIYNQYNHEITTHKQEDDQRLLLNWNKDLAVECNRRLDSSSIYSWSKYFVKDDVTKECENFEGSELQDGFNKQK